MDKNLYTLKKIKECLDNNSPKYSIETNIEDSKLYINRFEGELYDDFVTIAKIHIEGANVVDGDIIVECDGRCGSFCMQDSFVDELEENIEYDDCDVVNSKRYGIVYVPIERITDCILDEIQFIYDEAITVYNRHIDEIKPIREKNQKLLRKMKSNEEVHMARKTIEYKGEFKVKLDFVMTSGEGVDDATVEEVVKEIDENMFECILEALNSYFDDGEDSLQHLNIACEEIDHIINVADNTSEPETISEDLKTESGEE